MSSIQGSKQELAKKKADHENLKSRLNSIGQMYENVNDAFSHLNNYINQVASVNNLISMEMVKLNEGLVQKKEISKNLNSDIQEKNLLMSEIKNKNSKSPELIGNIKDEIKSLTKDFEIQKQENLIIENELSSMKNSSCEQLKEIDELKNQITEMTNSLGILKEKLGNIINSEKANNNNISQIDNDIKNLDNTIKDYEQQIHTLNGDITNKNVKKMSSQNNSLNYERNSMQMKQKLTEKEKQLNSLSNQIENFVKDKNDISNQLKLYQKQYVETNTQHIQNETKLQNEMIMQAQINGKSQVFSHQMPDVEKKCTISENEFKQACEELSHTQNQLAQLKNALVKAMSENHQQYSNDDTLIRQLTNEINEIRVKIDFVKNKQNTSRLLQQHIKKADEEMHSISSQLNPDVSDSQNEKYQSSKTKNIIQIPHSKTKGRILQLD